MAKIKKKMNVLDLFCGAGGFSEGFRQAGFNIVAGIDNNTESLDTYAFNFEDTIVFNVDLSGSFETDDKIISELPKDINVIIGGPPCQGFSIAGKRKANDPRNQLYKAYLHFISETNPQVILLENVPTILGLFGGKIADKIISDFNKLGYETKVFTLLASDYSIPQNRKRCFFIGLKPENNFRVPAPTTPYSKINTEDAIGDLPLLEDEQAEEILEYTSPPFTEYQELMRSGSDCVYNHWAVDHTSKTKSIISLVPDGGNYKDLPLELQGTRRVNIAWTRMNSKKPCFTIDTGHNHHFHYKANRVPTVRECARIQSFPDRFRFFGKKTGQFRQVGNAVPPLLAKVVACSLKDVLE